MDSKKSGNATSFKKALKKDISSEISSFDENRVMRAAVPRLFKVQTFVNVCKQFATSQILDRLIDVLGVKDSPKH